MSVYVMTWVFMHSPATGNDRLVLLAIADEADDEGLNARPGVRRIAEKSRADVSTAMRCTARLEAGGELLVLRPETKGRGRYNRYAVVMGRDPMALAQALGWPPPNLTGQPSDWLVDEVKAEIETEGEAELMVAKCDHSSGEERSTTRGNGGTSATQNDEKRAGMVAPDARRSIDPCSIDPRAAAPVRERPNPDPAPGVLPAHLSSGAPPRRSWRSPADPLDGIAAATTALAERARQREAELADEPALATPDWSAVRAQLHGASS